MLKHLLLTLTLVLGSISCRAQQATPQLRIVDVMPTVDPGTVPQTPLVSLDFLIGAWPHPVWWGRDWSAYNLDEPHVPALRDFRGQLTAITAKGQKQLEYGYCASYAPRWNEALGLYTVHVRVSFLKGGVRLWPKKTKMNFRGELPDPFDVSPHPSTLPFEVEIDELPVKGFSDAQLVSPRPSLWVKWVRVFRRSVAKGRPISYEADIMLSGRRAKIRQEVRNMPLFFDEQGQAVSPEGSGGYGVMSGGLGEANMGNFEFAESPLELVLQRLEWNGGYVNATADQFLQQRIEYGGREPLGITFPVSRDGVTLEGEIDAKDWKIESPALPSN